MAIFGETIERELPDLAEQGVRTRFIGRRDRVPDELREQMERLETRDGGQATRCCSGSRSTTAAAPRSWRRRAGSSRTACAPEDVDEDALAARLYAPDLPDPDLLIRTSGELRLSNFFLWQLAYSELVFIDTLWPDFGARRAPRRRSTSTRRRRRRFGGRERTVNQLVSRLLVAIVGLPIVLWLVWLGGWWLFGLALFAALVALHELYVMARGLRPLVLAGYAGALATLARRAARRAAVDARRLRARRSLLALPALRHRRDAPDGHRHDRLDGARRRLDRARARPPAAAARRSPSTAASIVFTVLLAVFADDTAAYLVGRLIGRHKLAPALSPGKTWEGFLAGTVAAVAVAFFALYEERETFLTIWQALVLGGVIAFAGAAGDLFESALKRDLQVKDSGRLLGGHGGMLDRVDALLFAAAGRVLRRPRASATS